jgi:hypothetical protein
MDRIDTDTKAEDLFGAGKHGFIDGDLLNAIIATRLNAKWFNNVQEELLSIIEGAGLVADDLVLTQVRQAIDVMVRKRAGCVCAAGGTADALTGDFAPDVAALVDGMRVIVRAGAANTSTTPTFKADGTALKTIVKGNNLPLVAGDISGAGHWLELQYDATLDKWILLNPAVPFGGFDRSLSTNGYQKLPGGLILQWGKAVTGGGGAVVTFPITFPNALFTVKSNANPATYISAAEARSTSGATIQARLWSTGNVASGIDVEYLAIGH